VISLVKQVLDSAPFRIFFAAWTGVYLIQVVKGEEGAPVNEISWIVIAAAFAVFLI
jgi:hypothetical protein